MKKVPDTFFACRVVVGSTVPSGTLFKRYFDASSVGGGYAEVYVGEWVANETYEIPFSAFAGVDFSQVTALTVGMQNDVTIPGGTAYNNTLTLTSISAVPEPQTLALLGTAGAAIVGGLTRRRGSREKKVSGTFFISLSAAALLQS